MTTLTVGSACPEFNLPDEAGTPVSSADLKGHAFVLYFYPKDDTTGCTREAIDFTALEGEFAAIGVPVFGVSPDSVKKHAKFRDKHGLKVRLLADEDKSLIEAAGAWVEKSMYGRSYMGVERSTLVVGKDGAIAAVWPKVKVPGHAEDVLAAARKAAA